MDDSELLRRATYIGDGLYMCDNGHHIVLFTYDGLAVTNRVYLDPDTLENFQRELGRMRPPLEPTNETQRS